VHPKIIGIIKDDKKEMYSKGSLAWLNNFTNMRHALNGGEISICATKFHGFDQEINTVYQYHGCFWHGCPKCYNEDTINNVNHESMGDLYHKSKERSKEIINAGFALIEMWECQWVKTKEYKNSNNVVEPLNPRDAFYGGRIFQVNLKSKTNYCGISMFVAYTRLFIILIIIL